MGIAFYSTLLRHDPNDFLRFLPSTAGDVSVGIGVDVCAGLLAGEGYAEGASLRVVVFPLVLTEETPFESLWVPLLVPFACGRGMELGGGPDAEDAV